MLFRLMSESSMKSADTRVNLPSSTCSLRERIKRENTSSICVYIYKYIYTYGLVFSQTSPTFKSAVTNKLLKHHSQSV